MLTKAGLRALTRRKLETIAIVVLVAVSVAGFLTIRMAANYALMLAGKAWAYEVGNIVISIDGIVDADKVVEALKGLPVDRFKLFEVLWTLGYYNDTPISLILAYNPNPGYPFSYTPSLNVSGNKVLLYKPGSKLVIPKGSAILIGPGGKKRAVIAGVVNGVAVIGTADLVVFADKALVEEISKSAGGITSGLSIVLKPGANVEEAKRIIVERLREAGYRVASMFTTTEEDNPARKPMEGVASALETLTLAGQAVGLLLISFTSLLAVERSTREVGVLESLGASKLQVAVFYSSHNIARGFLGAVIGLVLSMPLSRLLVEWGVGRASGSGSAASLLMRMYPFRPQLGSAAEPFTLILVAVIAAAMLPPLLYTRGEVAPKLRYSGRLGARPRLGLSIAGPETLLALRSLVARPWKLGALILLASLVWGSLASIGMVSKGYENVVHMASMAGFDIEVWVQPSKVDEARTVLSKVLGVQAIDTYLVYWHGMRLDGEEVAVIARISGSEYLWYPLVHGDLPKALGEVVVSTRLASELGIGIGSTIQAETVSGQVLYLRVVGVADIRTNNGLAILVNYRTVEKLLSQKAADGVLLVHSTRLSQDKLVLAAKRALGLKEIPADVVTKHRVLKSLRDAGSMLDAFMSVMESGVILAGLLGLILIGIADLAARVKEIGILRAIGYTDKRIALLQCIEAGTAWLLSSPLALVLGYAMARHMALLLREAMGTVQPAGPLSSLLAASWIVPLALVMTALTWTVYVKRIETVRLLAEE